MGANTRILEEAFAMIQFDPDRESVNLLLQNDVLPDHASRVCAGRLMGSGKQAARPVNSFVPLVRLDVAFNHRSFIGGDLLRLRCFSIR